MAADPLANIIDRLRGRGFQPRKVGNDLWESRCPGHASTDHALALSRSADGKLKVSCRSTENCSLSRIVKKLDLKVDRLFTQTNPALIRKLKEAEILPSIYVAPDATAPAAVDPDDTTAATELDAAPMFARGMFADEANFEVNRPPDAHDDQSIAAENSDNSPDPGTSPETVDDDLGPIVSDAASDNATTSEPTKTSKGVAELLTIARNARTFRRADGGYSLSRDVDDHAECHDLDSPEVRRWLTRAYHESTGRLPSTAAVSGALVALAAHADIEKSHALDFVRVGRNEAGTSYFIDLGDSSWAAVEITATGWEVVSRPPVHFRRAPGQLALPMPARDGHIALIKKYVNVENNDLPLLVGWITAALRPIGPHPILVITGEQGSAKSTLARVCRLLVDPHAAPLRAEPREHRDLMVAALNGWVQAYDNISTLPDWLSNGLCRLVTGGGISMRGLYTNHEEIVWSAQRPIILNGIDEFVQRPDVLDRSICLQLRPILARSRRAEEDFWAAFMEDYPLIFGGVLDAVAAGMRDAPTIGIAELERMADFHRWGEAVAQSVHCPAGTFSAAYRGNRRATSAVALEESGMADAILSVIKYPGQFKGTITQLLYALEGYTGSGRLTVPNWPRTPNKAASELRRIAPLLRTVGVSVTFERGTNGTRLVEISSIDRDGYPVARRA